MSKLLSYLLLAFIAMNFLCPNAIARKQVDRVVVIINNTIITLSEFEEAASLNGINLEEPGNDYKFLEQLIDKIIIEQEAKKARITVTDAEVEQNIQELQSHHGLDEKAMEKTLKEQNLTKTGFRNQWKFQLLTKKLIHKRIRGNIVVTDQEVKEYYRQIYGEDLNEGTVSEFKIAHILILNDSPNAEQKAAEIADKAKAGENFAELAKKHSQDKISAANGGDLGYFKTGDLVESLESAIQGIKVNQVVGPVESPGGYHIIKVLDRKNIKNGISHKYYDEIKANLYNQKAEEILKDYLKTIKDSAYIERKL